MESNNAYENMISDMKIAKEKFDKDVAAAKQKFLLKQKEKTNDIQR